MLYVVLIPALVWVTVLLATWGTLAYYTSQRVGLRGPVLSVWLGILALQAIAASAAAISTSLDPINSFACATGIFGMPISLAVTALAAVVLVMMRKHWPRYKERNRDGFAFTASIWLLLSIVAILAHMRSAALCTV